MPSVATPQAEAAPSLEASARDPGRSGAQARVLRQAARAGLAGASVPYPHGDRIRRAFGQYAPEGLRAHMGPAAMAAAGRMNAAAFVLNGRAAFAASPSLRTAAHEAVHLAHHERGGAALPHGVGGVGDRHERLADRVADTVAAGRSAEPLLAAALPAATGPAVAPMLQLSPNTVSGKSFQTLNTPWTEIQSQLPFNDPQATVKLLRDVPVDALRGPFTRMMGRLKGACDRADEVTADINGDRPGKARSGDATQTAYGTLGQLEAYLNESPSPDGEQFEGGHLISDQVLGENSYEEWNFAPQRRNLNSPDYRAIEMIASAGLKAKASAAKGIAAPTATYRVTVQYPDDSYPVAREAIERLLGYASLVDPLAPKPASPPPIKAPVYKAGSTLPDKVELTPRVPTLWVAVVNTPSADHEFSRQSTITAGKAMDAAFVTGEHNVAALPSSSGEYTGPIKWSMDTMSSAKPKSRKSWGTIGSGTHTFTAVQSAPRNPKAIAASSASASGPAVVPTPPPSAVKPLMPSTGVPSPHPTPGGPQSSSIFGSSSAPGPSYGSSAFTAPNPFNTSSAPSHTPSVSSSFGSTTSSFPGFGGYNPFQTSFAPSAPLYTPPPVSTPYNPFQASFAPSAPLHTPPPPMLPYYPPLGFGSSSSYSAPPLFQPPPPQPPTTAVKRDRNTNPGAQPGDSKKSRKRDRGPEEEEDGL